VAKTHTLATFTVEHTSSAMRAVDIHGAGRTAQLSGADIYFCGLMLI
jgi:hypothetical protein